MKTSKQTAKTGKNSGISPRNPINYFIWIWNAGRSKKIENRFLGRFLAKANREAAVFSEKNEKKMISKLKIANSSGLAFFGRFSSKFRSRWWARNGFSTGWWTVVQMRSGNSLFIPLRARCTILLLLMLRYTLSWFCSHHVFKKLIVCVRMMHH